MIMVITITGIIGGMVAVFLNAPIQQYMDVARRAELTDIADMAVRRMARDLRTAVPNSLRLPNAAGSTYVEMLPARTGGRYRAVQAGGGTGCNGVAGNRVGEALSFNVADTCFGIIGPPIVFVAGDGIVIGSTQSDGDPPYDTTAAGVLRMYAGAGGSHPTVRIPAVVYPAFAELDSQRFFVVSDDQQAVTYACIGTLGTLDANQDGQASLMRYWRYGFNVAQVAPPLAGGSSAILAGKVSACNIKYDAVNQRYGLVTITLTLTSGGESVSLLHEIHVNNVP